MTEPAVLTVIEQPVYHQDLMKARALLAQNNANYKEIAECLLRAQAAGASQRVMAKTIGLGLSQYSVNRVLKWHADGCPAGGPYAADNEKKRLVTNHSIEADMRRLAREQGGAAQLRQLLKDAEELLPKAEPKKRTVTDKAKERAAITRAIHKAYEAGDEEALVEAKRQRLEAGMVTVRTETVGGKTFTLVERVFDYDREESLSEGWDRHKPNYPGCLTVAEVVEFKLWEAALEAERNRAEAQRNSEPDNDDDDSANDQSEPTIDDDMVADDEMWPAKHEARKAQDRAKLEACAAQHKTAANEALEAYKAAWTKYCSPHVSPMVANDLGAHTTHTTASAISKVVQWENKQFHMITDETEKNLRFGKHVKDK
jgi:hypothetical protein